jgi:hypothetical protein
VSGEAFLKSVASLTESVPLHLHATATVIGKVRLKANASVWFGAVLRGDNEWIEIERATVFELVIQPEDSQATGHQRAADPACGVSRISSSASM